MMKIEARKRLKETSLEVTSTPYLMQVPLELSLNDSGTGELSLEKLKQQPHKTVGKWHGVPLVEYKIKDEYLIVLEYEGQVGYYVHVVPQHFPQLQGRQATQVEVWRSRYVPGAPTRGLATYVFFDLILKRNQHIVSDSMHTAKGKDFWLDVLVEALSRKLKVGYFDTRDSEVTYFDPAHERYREWITVLEKKAWGRSSSHERQRLVISK